MGTTLDAGAPPRGPKEKEGGAWLSQAGEQLGPLGGEDDGFLEDLFAVLEARDVGEGHGACGVDDLQEYLLGGLRVDGLGRGVLQNLREQCVRDPFCILLLSCGREAGDARFALLVDSIAGIGRWRWTRRA